jgi:outer membrane biosynthesis protein TonB
VKTHLASRIVRLILFSVLAIGSFDLCADDRPSCAAVAEPTALKIRKDSGVTPPRATYRKEPKAQSSLADGTIATIAAIIGEDGHPRHVCQMSGNEEWGRAVMEAFQSWRFEPATLNGSPVAVQFTLTTKLKRR